MDFNLCLFDVKFYLIKMNEVILVKERWLIYFYVNVNNSTNYFSIETQNSFLSFVPTWSNTNVSSSISYSDIFLFEFLIKLNKEIHSFENFLSWFKFLEYNGYEILVSVLWSTDRIKSSRKQKDLLAPVNTNLFGRF